MHTQCPHCQTIFRVTAAHLNIAQGYARCSNCRNVFNATNQLVKQLYDKTIFKPLQAKKNDNSIISLQEDDIPELLKEDIYAAPSSRPWRSFFMWGIVVVLMTALLGGQSVWFWQRDTILQHPQIRPWLERFCYTFLCILPPTQDLSSFYMQQHVPQIHPEQKDVIQFEAIFINKATFSQPYPYLQLTFEDSNGKALTQNLFKPSEYLPTIPHPKQQMRPKESVHIKLELKNTSKIIEDGELVEGYRFDFF